MSNRLLVTGGAGYVGSHCARRLIQAGFEVITIDDLSQGHRQAVEGPLLVADVRDRAALRAALGGVDAVLHFAARTSVGESQIDPVGYWEVNVGGSAALLGAMIEAGVRRLVFSSTCAVHGIVATPITEDIPFAPESPYGGTKAATERMIVAAEAAGQLEAVRLRYFNAAGAASDAWLGEAHAPETHLIPLALAAASGGPALSLFGDAHPTADGTCIRDYVHVEDLAEAHLTAVLRLFAGGGRTVFNLGTGRGASVREVFTAVERVVGPVQYTVAPPRLGDPPALVADPRASLSGLNWRATRDLDTIVSDAWRWRQNPRFGPDFHAPGQLATEGAEKCGHHLAENAALPSSGES